MKRFLKSTVAASALAITLAFASSACAERKPDPKIRNGGSIIITYKDDVSTLDPAIGYDWQNWTMIRSLFDGLMDYELGSTKLKPDLAESYEISPDGTVFTFKLRQGVKFQNGRELTAEDVKYSLDRVTDPKTQSPGAGFFSSIKGYEEAASGKAQGLSGVTVVDPYTVKLELTRPDATFLHVMAINFSFVVPKEEVEKWGADFGKHPVGSGAFKLAEWTLGQRIVFQRNSDYRDKTLPHLDNVTFEIGQEPIVSLLRLQKGEIDIPGDGIPPAKFQEVMSDPDQKARVVVGRQLHTGYITMNVNIKPFDNVKVRQAVNMAINKNRIVQLINNRAVAANQVLPPAMPGYNKDLEGYPYDPAKAKELLAEAGFADGFKTQLYAVNTDPNPRIAQAIQQDLAAVGIKASIQALAQANVIDAGGQKDGAPMIWSGGMAWIADFPDPSNFYGPILGCGGAVPGGWNWSWYCNKDLDAKAAAADTITDPAKAEERNKAWTAIYDKIVEDAPWAPLFNEQRFLMKSARLAGPDYLYVGPVNTVNYDNIYVNDVQ